MSTLFNRLIWYFFLFIPLSLEGLTYDYAEIDPLNNLYLVSKKEGIIVRISSEGSVKKAEGSTFLAELQEPVGLQLQFPTSLWVMDRLNRTMVEFDMSLHYLRRFVLPDILEDPIAFLITPDGRWLISDAMNQKIWQLSPGLSSPTPWGIGQEFLTIPPDMSLTGGGNRVYCFSPSESVVWIADSQGRLLFTYAIPDSIHATHIAGGWEEHIFISGSKGTWMVSPKNPPQKIDPIPCLKIWENIRIYKDGTFTKKGFAPFVPKGTLNP
ncbi:MAG: hypothetical protein PHS99_08250 [Candidatus Marinimicrobia bacterium]|nr:hypothetical protein [Candidatus Neomarinimicrobiota bacterium]